MKLIPHSPDCGSSNSESCLFFGFSFKHSANFTTQKEGLDTMASKSLRFCSLCSSPSSLTLSISSSESTWCFCSRGSSSDTLSSSASLWRCCWKRWSTSCSRTFPRVSSCRISILSLADISPRLGCSLKNT